MFSKGTLKKSTFLSQNYFPGVDTRKNYYATSLYLPLQSECIVFLTDFHRKKFNFYFRENNTNFANISAKSRPKSKLHIPWCESRAYGVLIYEEEKNRVQVLLILDQACRSSFYAYTLSLVCPVKYWTSEVCRQIVVQ